MKTRGFGNTAEKLRIIAEQAATITTHEHPLPLLKLNNLEITGTVKIKREIKTHKYKFDGTGSYCCSFCRKLRYSHAHHCKTCFPSFDICEDCFDKQKTADLSSVKTKVLFQEAVIVQKYESDEEDDPFSFQETQRQLTSDILLADVHRGRFGRLLEVLFPSSRVEDLAAEAQGLGPSKMDFSVMESSTGRTMLHYAAEAGEDRVVLGLLMHVDKRVTNNRDHYGLTPLMLASMKGNTAVVEELLYGEANTECCCCKGYTALMLAVCYGWSDIASRLLFSGASVNTKSKEGRSALSIAALNGHTACAQRLLQCEDIDLYVKDSEGYTPMLLAAAGGFQNIIDLFPKEARNTLLW